MRRLLNSFHHFCARSSFLTRLAVVLRNQVDCVIAYHLGEWADSEKNGESRLLELVAPHCRSVFDVGANVGEWTELARRHTPEDCRFILVEPGDAAYAQLLEKFGDDEAIAIEKCAAGSEPGEMTFHEGAGCSETSSLVAQADIKDGEAKTVAIKTIDGICEAGGIDAVDFLKIDAEGFDLRVLEGTAGLLERRVPQVIQFEYNAPWAQAGSTLFGALDLLKSNGYEVYLLRSTGLSVPRYDYFGEYFRYSNYIAVTGKGREWVADLIEKN